MAFPLETARMIRWKIFFKYGLYNVYCSYVNWFTTAMLYPSSSIFWCFKNSSQERPLLFEFLANQLSTRYRKFTAVSLWSIFDHKIMYFHIFIHKKYFCGSEKIGLSYYIFENSSLFFTMPNYLINFNRNLILSSSN